MDKIFITIVFFILLAFVFLLIFLFKSTKASVYQASDGTVFNNKSDLDVYQSIYEKTKPLFSNDDDINTKDIILGFDKQFLNKLKSDGFSDLKTIVEYRNQFKSLSNLINI